MSSGWGCPHDSEGKCQRRGDEECDPGAEGCVLEEGLRQSAEALCPDRRNPTEKTSPVRPGKRK